MITVEYILEDLPDGIDLDIKEDRGRVVYRVGRHLTPQQMIRALNEGTGAVIAGGHWFQEWKGDIITVDPSEVLGADEPRAIPTQRPTLYNVNGPQTGAA